MDAKPPDIRPPLVRIADERVSGEELRRALAEIAAAPPSEPPAFWSAIAGDPRYAPDHRRQAAVQLFRRHVRPGMTVAELAAVLARPPWLRDADVAVVSALGGKIPVRMTSGDTVLVLNLLPELPAGQPWAIYLRIEGRLDRDRLAGVLLGARTDPEAASARLLEIGVFAPP